MGICLYVLFTFNPSWLQSGLSPVQIFQDNATEERAENARLSAFVGAIAVGDLDKILQSVSNHKDVMVTNDGATILKSIALDNAAAKVLVNISKVQDDEGSTNLDHIQIIKKHGGKLTDSYLDEGFILDKKIGVNQPKRKMRAKVNKIKAHGINCFVNRQLIYNWPEQLFADSGVAAIEHADFDGIERLALVTGGEIASTFDHPELVRLGHCDLIEEIIIGEDKLIKFSGVAAGEACTIVLRGATNQLLDEAERSLHDALCVLSQTIQEPRTVLGGGCSEMLMAKAAEETGAVTPGKQAIAIEAFSRALRQLPMILADNAGYDSADLVSKLRAAHAKGNSTYGLVFKLKRQVLLSASEAAEMVLRVDNIIRCAPRQRNRE
ncbi:hypothetical protein BSLG_000751 [Batrachochytrium salamandrivorans]|nr:hypothetical protein BSLG_000751 [Batrachochytrium salamandrivorans]